MNLYLLVRQTHVLSMVVSLVLAVIAEALLIRAACIGQVERLARRCHVAERVLKVSDLTRFLGFLAGIALVIIGGWNPLAPWLVAAYGWMSWDALALAHGSGSFNGCWRIPTAQP